jgi:hypothetical protein
MGGHNPMFVLAKRDRSNARRQLAHEDAQAGR